MLGAVKPPTGRLTVVLDPWVTAQFLGLLGYTLNGDAVAKGRSLFADRLGESVASPLVTLVDDPTDIRAMTATDTDGEGLATRRNVLVKDGVLEMFVHNAYTARRAGTVSTGNAVRGFKSTPSVDCMFLTLQPGTTDPSELIAGIDDGVLVQEVSGLHSGVNPVSGDFSTGAEGLRIRGGEVAEPVREFTIASTLQKMLHDVQAVGNDLQFLPMNAAGVSLVVADLTLSGS
jgi:PmbA protein